MNQTDEADAGISNLVNKVNNKERHPWRCFSNSTLPRSEVIFFDKVSIIVLLIILCFSMLFFYQKTVKRNQFGLISYQV